MSDQNRSAQAKRCEHGIRLGEDCLKCAVSRLSKIDPRVHVVFDPKSDFPRYRLES